MLEESPTTNASQLSFQNGQVRRSKESRASEAALTRRMEHQREVIAMGITPEALDTIVDEFYIRVRQHALLAPVFENQIGDDWSEHLKKMKSFWLSVALNAGTYAGKPHDAHKALTRVKAAHFGIWLGLFRQTVKDVVGSDEAVAYLQDRAERMAASFKTTMGLTDIKAATSRAETSDGI